MSEIIDSRQIFSLSEVTKSISRVIASRYASTYWIKAEMNKLNHYSHSGHCYPDLIEKSKGKVVAEMRGVIWSDDYRRINKQFVAILKEPLKDGINILICSKITFDPIYGISLNIIDIDPSFTLGELESEKQRTIQSLNKEDLFTFGKRLKFPLLARKIAVISVETSKGYADFLNTLDNNAYSYRFFHMLFPALLQGEKAVNSILSQLKNIEKVKHHFDIVVIVRGGGGDVGLSCYNNYALAKAIAQFPIPVLTGIGHSTNVTVSEMIAYINAITPTALAELLIKKFNDYVNTVEKAKELIILRTNRRLSQENVSITNMARLLRSSSLSRIVNHSFQLDNLRSKLQSGIHGAIVLNKSSLDLLGHKKEAMDPMNVIRRGYTMTLHEGKILKNTDDIRLGDALTTILESGRIKSTIDEVTREEVN